jgi:Domain of unknown function (DUF4055)
MATTATQAGLPGGPISAVTSGVMQTDEVEAGRRALGMSPRQQVLDKYWSFYRCDQYAARSVAWDGSRHLGMVERDTVALAGYVPPGFYVANPDTLPVALRRPSTPYHITKVIVDRFTSMLFSQKRHPKITVEGDPKTEDFLNAVAETGRLWPTMMRARAHGGGMGTAVVGFKLLAGRPVFEVFDPRWCHPKFLDRGQLVLESLDYRYVFTQEVRDDDGTWREIPYWYRRVIDRVQDVVFRPLPVEDNVGQHAWQPGEVVEHKLGFCPVVWIQNQPNETDLDGDPDCLGVLDMAEAIDRLNSQSEKGTIANCDPTVVLSTNAEMGAVTKGSGSAIKMPMGSDAKYMEMAGTGITAARQKVGDYKEMLCEVAACVLTMPDRQMTATEVERIMAPMLAKADMLREQYGEQGVKRLLNMICVAAKRITTPRAENGGIKRQVFALPDKIVTNQDGTTAQRVPRVLGDGPYQVSLTWPSYYEPGVQDATSAVNTAVTARAGGLIDLETAVNFIATYFGIENVRILLQKLQQAEGDDQAALSLAALTGPKGAARAQAQVNAGESPSAGPGWQHG